MKVIRATAMGMCFGVRDALAVVEQIENPEAVTIYGELVHNPAVLVQLDARGFRSTAENKRAELPTTKDVLITAHGVSDRERERLLSNGKRLIDTTCPLVQRVHRAAQQLAADGYFVLVIGRRGHVEVQGIVEDLEEFAVIETVSEARNLHHARLGIVCQSTTPPDQAQSILSAIRQQNPASEIQFVDTICQPTRDRQQAIDELLEQVDAMVVVGGENSNNTRELVVRCQARGLPAFHIQTAAQLDPEWFGPTQTVGLTAGTSTLATTIEDVYLKLCSFHQEVCR